ncbi:CaiB/BaiF CoA-transferase family protein [Amycolatopsis sp. Poz14]|uniref:CaiB/BaiF CoA transferase family protein n=1 Tax=Amycolatopsis sp. Poz14 TaxID=1447705 RepID=UPI001EE7D4A4|nr:CaiB/BaiF CoA-transferase family protein [Amycolatopsis sp. Poz14]MCG3753923.1 CoA transferase [Amycolatopsis sp. Poz14]
MGPLDGVRVVEVGSIGPGPWCAMMLSDMGAEVLRLDRADQVGGPAGRPIDFVNRRGRRSVGVDLKHPEGAEVVLRLAEKADALIEGFRPGVAERLGIGPKECLERNPRLVYGRMTGWGQDGPLAQVPGHDINYLALTGLLHAIGPAERPMPPLNLVGDFGGGGLLLAFGVVCGVLEAARSGQGQVFDSAMLDGAALLGSMVHGLRQTGSWHDRRESNRHDGGAPFYGAYETSDGRWVAIAANEPRFYRVLVEALGLDLAELPPQLDQESWPAVRAQFAEIFRTRTREEWVKLMAPLDTCFSPVLTLDEAREHEHNVAREVFVPHDGVLQAAPAPRFERTPGRIQGPAPLPGEHTSAALADWGFADDEIGALLKNGAVSESAAE